MEIWYAAKCLTFNKKGNTKELEKKNKGKFEEKFLARDEYKWMDKTKH